MTITANQTRSPEMEVRLGERLDGLYISGVGGTSHRDAMRWLMEATGQSGLRRTASGILLPEQVAESIRKIEGSRVRWSSKATRFLENRLSARQRFPSLLTDLARIKLASDDELLARIADSEGLATLDRHQLRNVAAMTMPGGFGLCVFDEQGAGKTVTLIFAYDLLVARNAADRLIVIAPKSMIAEWPKDIQRFRPALYRVAVVSGSRREKLAALRTNPDVIVTNYETAISLEAELTAMFRVRPGRTVLAVDESFFVKSLDARRTMAIRRLREWCGSAFVLCGTPAPNSSHDLVQQFNVVDYGLAFEGVTIPEDREQAAPVVQQVLDERGLYLRHLKSEVLPDLPEKRFQRIFVPLEGAQRMLYERLANDLADEIESVSDVEFRRRYSHFLARRAALLQVCSNPAAIDATYSEVPAKLRALDSIVEELAARREKAVIWAFYTQTITLICERYARFGALRYDGEVTDVATRREAVRRFQDDDDCLLFVANPAAAGAGLTLHRARYAIYESFSNQAAHYLQSLDRIHRRGQTRDVEYIILLADGTIELAEYERLIQKEAAAQELLGDAVSAPLTRTSFLEETRRKSAAR